MDVSNGAINPIMGGSIRVVNDNKWIIASLMRDAGLRLMECPRLRVQDLDFARNEILVRDGKGSKNRIKSK